MKKTTALKYLAVLVLVLSACFIAGFSIQASAEGSVVCAGPVEAVPAGEKKTAVWVTVREDTVTNMTVTNLDTNTSEVWVPTGTSGGKAVRKIVKNGDGTETWYMRTKLTKGTTHYKVSANVGGTQEADFFFNVEATDDLVYVQVNSDGAGRKVRLENAGYVTEEASTWSKLPVRRGSLVRLTAVNSSEFAEGSSFYYWANASTGKIMSTDEVYSYYASDTSVLTACYRDANQLRSILYLSKSDRRMPDTSVVKYNISIPEDPTGFTYVEPTAPNVADYEFVRWDTTPAEAIASDEIIVVIRPIYKLKSDAVVTIAEGDYKTTGAGTYSANDNERPLVSVSASKEDFSFRAFSYWMDADTQEIVCYTPVYTFLCVRDVNLKPVYGAEAERVPLVRIVKAQYNEKNLTVNFWAERCVPGDCKVAQTGIILTKTAATGASATSFVLGGTGVTKAQSSSTANDGFYHVSVSDSGSAVYARGYVSYFDADGALCTVYSDIYTFNG